MAEDLAKIIVPLPSDNLARADTESMWAEPQGDGMYRVKNIPFFARGFSRDDIVKVQANDDVLMYDGVQQHNGHSTYQVYVKVPKSDTGIVDLTTALSKMRCSVEFATDRLFSVDVYPEADIYAVYAALERAESEGLIDFQEAHYGHNLNLRSHEDQQTAPS